MAAVSNRARKLLAERVAQLGPTEHDEIFKLVRAHDIKHSCNANGVFIAMSAVPDDVIQKISAMVEYHITNNKHLEAREKSLHQYKITHNIDTLVSATETGAQQSLLLQTELPPQAEAVPVAAPTTAPAQVQAHVQALVQATLPSAAEIAASCAASTQPPRGKTVTMKFQQTKKRFARRRTALPAMDVALGPTDGGGCVLLPEAYLVG